MYRTKKFMQAEKKISMDMKEFLLEKIKYSNPRRIAFNLNVDPCTIRRWLDRFNIKRKHNKLYGESKKPTRQKLKTLYEDRKLTTKQIGNKYGVTKETIRLWLKSYNIKRRERFLYNDFKKRKEYMDEFLQRIRKEPEEITPIDFYKTERNDGLTYKGLLIWYKRNFKCDRISAIEKMVEDLFPRSTSK